MYSHWIDIIWICLVVIPSTHVFSARRLLHTYHIGHWTNLWCVCSASLVESCDVLYYTFYNTFRNLTTVHSGNIKTHKKNDNNKIISNNISQVIFTSTTTRSKTTTTTPRSKTGTFLFGQSGFCAIYTEWLCCPLFGAMAEDVCKTVAFLAAYSDELVQLNKHTLEALLKSNRAKQVKEWNAAKTFWYRKLSTLLPEHREELDDWEFILCNMSKLEPAAFLPRLRRCFNRVDSFITERAEAIHKLACQNLETALQRKHMLQFPMSTFTRIFLERYKDKLETEQMEALSMWTENLCVQSASDRDAVTARRAARLISVQEFLAHFAAEIVGLQKQTLRDVVMSTEKKKYPQWMNATNFFRFDYVFLNVEEKDLLEDWELVLCDKSALESVALLPGLQRSVAFLPRLLRCFKRVDSFITERAETIKKLACNNLETALGSKHMSQFPMSTFSRIFLERYKDKLETEQMEALSMWTENLCVQSASDRDGVTARRAAALRSVQEFFACFAAEIVGLQKETLRDVVMSNEANKYPQWKQAQSLYVRDYVFLNVEEKDLLEDWELVLCDKSASESVAFLPRLLRCFKRVDSFIAERGEAIRKIGCKKLETALGSKHMSQFPMSTFTRIFLERYKDKLETEQMEALSMWTENLCVQSASERDAVTARRAARLISVQEFFAHFAAEIVGLQKQTLRDVVMSNESNKNPQWMNATTFFRRDYVFLNVEEKDLLEDWELVLCDKSASESVAFLPRLTRSFDRVKAVVGEQKEVETAKKSLFSGCFSEFGHASDAHALLLWCLSKEIFSQIGSVPDCRSGTVGAGPLRVWERACWQVSWDVETEGGWIEDLECH